jgi:hypothetical protein
MSAVEPPEEDFEGRGQGQDASAVLEGRGDEAICRVCLGVLQSLDGPLRAVSAELQMELSDRDGGGAPWSPVARGDVNSIADHIRCTIALAPPPPPLHSPSPSNNFHSQMLSLLRPRLNWPCFHATKGLKE